MERSKRTDLAFEQREILRGAADAAAELPGVSVREELRRGFHITALEVLDKRGADALCKPIGKYYTVELSPLLSREPDAFESCAAVLAELLRELLEPAEGCTLVAGLGNSAITPDAVGPLALDSVMVTRHLKRSLPTDFAAFADVAALCTGVTGVTGMESAELLRSVCAGLDPGRIIAVDALASASLKHLCATVQLSDAGIVPGSGVGNDRAELCRHTLGAQVVAVGVPTVTDAGAFTDEEDAKGMFITTRDIDARVRDCAKLIGYAVNLALHEGISITDVDMFLS